ncbi:MAG: aldolase/citrate lyase family protein [Kiritimatiellae bacterium]|nr:aldolase/citrate lyase family protein [Kiritimatiellia bacterium]
MNLDAIATLRDSRFHLGTWLSSGSPVVAELAGLAGFDWLLIDLEHGCGGEAALFQQLQALRGTRSAVIVRVGAPHPDAIQRVLDWGADGVMVPHVDTAETARACVRCLRFPPGGTRGFSRSVRACDYGYAAPVKAVQPLFFAQIESAEAVRNVASIAAVDGVDVLFVGPADLRCDLDATPCDLDLEACLEAVAEAARSQGRQAGILNRDDAEIAPLAARGFHVQAVDSDMAILRRRQAELVARHAQG